MPLLLNPKDHIMKKTSKFVTGAAAALGLGLVLTAAGCAPVDNPDEKAAVQSKAAGRKAYLPKNDVEFKNYNRSQELYDNPNAIQWCSAFPSSASAPIVTIAIAGKLTTSGTSYFSPTEVRESSVNNLSIPARSVDGMFHGESFYRYGFTPAGQYVDFSNSMELLCTTALTEFQRQNTFVEGVAKDTSADDITRRQAQAEAALKAGDAKKAANILEGK
jgi:hypothetical protein